TASTAGGLPPAGEWALAAPRRKLHACCGYIHSPVDALVQLKSQLPGGLEQGRVQVRVAPYVADVVSKQGLPTSPNDARFHLQYCMATAMLGADVIRPEHSIDLQRCLADPAIVEAMARVEVVADPALNHYHQCEVVYTTTDGRELVQA